MKKNGILIRLLFLAIFVSFWIPSSLADDLKDTRRHLDFREIIGLLRENKAIENAVIRAGDIDMALDMTRRPSTGDEPTPPLVITNSIIKGSLILSDRVVQKGKKLPDDVKQHFDRQPTKFEPIIWNSTPLVIISSTIEGFVDLRGKIVDAPIQFTNVVVRGEMDCRGAIFTSRVQFDSNTIFESAADFAYTTFKHDVDFKQVSFQQNAYFHDASMQHGYFLSSDFQRDASFDATSVLNDLQFREGSFKGRASFRRMDINSGLFNELVFHSDVDFGEMHIKAKVRFYGVSFLKDAFFSDINRDHGLIDVPKSSLVFFRANFDGRLYFDHARLGKLWFSTKTPSEESTPTAETVRWPASPVRIKNRAIFNGLECQDANFTETEFLDYADFGQAWFINSANFTKTTFEKEVSFREASFPLRQSADHGLTITELQIQRTTDLTWDQIHHSVAGGRETWSNLEGIFKRSGDLYGQNQSMYLRRLHETRSRKLLDILDWSFWGYGVRPWRLVSWIVLLTLLFTYLYWTQTSAIANHKNKWEACLDRIRFALVFSLRTAWTFGYGYRNSRTTKFKVITLAHSIVFKFMLLCLFKVISNVSPLLNEFVSRAVRL